MAVFAGAAAAVAGNNMPYASPSGTSGSAQKAITANDLHARAQVDAARSDDRNASTWVLFGMLVFGLGAVTIRMLRYRREVQISIFRRFRRELDRRTAPRASGSPLPHQP
jgi:hypothetical protein